MSEKDNEVVVTLHGQEVLKLDPRGDITFLGNFIKNDLEANKRFLRFFQDNITKIIEGDTPTEGEEKSSACGSCTGC